jgi:hypothetical protein
MRFKMRAARQGLAHGFDLHVGNYRGRPGEFHETLNAWRAQYIDPLFKSPSQEQIAGKQGLGNYLGSVTPLANRGVSRQEYLEALVSQRALCQVLVLVPGVERKPTGVIPKRFSVAG